MLALPLVWLSVQLGQMLAWDQIALYAVTVLSNLAGVDVAEILRDEFRFLRIDGREIDPDVYLATFVVHLLLAGLLTAGWLALGAIGARAVRPAALRTGPSRTRTEPPNRSVDEPPRAMITR